MTPYYEENGITLYNCDCREVLRDLSQNTVVLTGPPWFEDRAISDEIVHDLDLLKVQAAIIQWNELIRPPCPMPLIAIYAWVHGNRARYQPFYHFSRNAEHQESQAIVVAPEYRDHPHQFPVEVAEWLLGKLPPDLTVLDPFCGSGTVLLAARKLGRKAIGIEIEEKYAEVAANRLRALDSAYKR
jgi:site-specific DNA-methyltransferase (adenine-specific)